MIEASGLEEVPEAFFCIHVWLRTLMPWKKAGNRTGRSEGPPNRETEDDYSAFMQAMNERELERKRNVPGSTGRD